MWPYTASTPLYSDSTPGSMRDAWERTRNMLDPTIQKRVESGAEIHRRGIPMMNSPVYSFFWSIVWPPTSTGSGALRWGEKGVEGWSVTETGTV